MIQSKKRSSVTDLAEHKDKRPSGPPGDQRCRAEVGHTEAAVSTCFDATERHSLVEVENTLLVSVFGPDDERNCSVSHTGDRNARNSLIDSDHAALQLCRDSATLLPVFAKDGCTQPIPTSVQADDNVVHIIVRHDCHDWRENLILRNVQVEVNITQQSRLKVSTGRVAGVSEGFTTSKDDSALRDSFGKMGLQGWDELPRNQTAYVDCFLVRCDRWTAAKAANARLYESNEALILRTMNEETFEADTVLSSLGSAVSPCKAHSLAVMSAVIPNQLLQSSTHESACEEVEVGARKQKAGILASQLDASRDQIFSSGHSNLRVSCLCVCK